MSQRPQDPPSHSRARHRARLKWLLAVLASCSLLAGACSSNSDDADAADDSRGADTAPTEPGDPSEDAEGGEGDSLDPDVSLAPVGYGDFNDGHLDEMRNADSPDAIYVISLLAFKARAAYADGQSTDLTGEEAYDLYASAGHAQRFGGELVHSAEISITTTDSDVSRDTSTWDRVEINRYPNRASYVAMYDDAEYQSALVHKDAGLETAVVMVSELTMSSTSDVLPLESGPDVIHVGELLQFSETAHYDPPREPAITGKDADVLYEKGVVAESIRFGLAVPVGDFSIEGVLVGDGRTWDEFRLSQFQSRESYDDWTTGSLRQAGLVDRAAGTDDSEIVVSEPPTVNRLPEIPAAQPWRWFTMGSMEPEGRATLFSNWQLVTPVSTAQASSTPREFPRTLVDPDDIFYEHDGTRRSIAEYIDRAAAAGLLVMRDGNVVLEHYGLGIGPESRFHIWSASKSFTSTLVAIAAHEGKIASLDDTVSTYVPEFSDTAYGDTSIRHVLMMASGVDFFHSGDPGRTDLYWDVVNQEQSIDDWTAALDRRVSAGTDFNYILTDTHVLSAVLRAVYDMPFAEILETKLWQPAGFASDATWGQNTAGPEGHALGHCCLSLTLQDFAHLGQLYLEDLVIDGEQVVPADWVENVAEPGVGDNYSLQFWLPPDHDQEFMALGAFSNYLWIDKARGFTVAHFGTPPPREALSDAEYAAAMRALGDAVSGT